MQGAAPNPLPHLHELCVNKIAPDQLFAFYQAAKFLYPEKLERLRPFLSLIQENWARMMNAHEPLLWVFTVGDGQAGMSSVTKWRSTVSAYVTQHWVSQHNPAGLALLSWAMCSISRESFRVGSPGLVQTRQQVACKWCSEA